ncbi:MAG TPA: sigma factor-like helix-turn-helix DNA-binding protein [Terriglobales bacterium]|nr:sigma factor-like helix-turn-helix DNA-binding protein [Terriglobales bacterium]
MVLHATASPSRADHPISRSPDRPIADLDPELSLYRPRTLAVLRRYLRISSAVGRLPSIIAREVFRARVSHYRIHTFEESVIFVLDVERALARLHHDDQQVIARVVFQGHSHDAAARLLGWKRRTVTRSLCEALDRLSELMLARGLLRKM